MNELIVFPVTAKAVAIHSKFGSGARVMRAKEFKEIYRAAHPNASSRDVKSAFNAYYRGAVSANCADVAAAMTTGHYGVEQYVETKTGKLKLVLVDKRRLSDAPTDAEINLAQQLQRLSTEEKRQYYNQLKEALFSNLSDERAEATAS